MRHGQTAHNVLGLLAGWTDTPLTDVGVLQAERAAEHIAETYRLDAIYSSPLQRAHHTAKIVGRHSGLEPRLVEPLKELHFGQLEGLSEDDIAQQYPEAWAAARDRTNLDFAWPGGESRRSFQGRVRSAIDRIAKSHPRETVAVVAHGGVLGCYLADVIEGKPQLWLKYCPNNCAVSEVAIRDQEIRVVRLNDTSCLTDGPSPVPVTRLPVKSLGAPSDVTAAPQQSSDGTGHASEGSRADS